MPNDDEDPRKPWYARREVQVFIFRINRRPLAQPTLFSQDPPPAFLDHVAEALLMGFSVTTGRRYQREWLLGNREIDEAGAYLSGWIGYDTTGPGRKDRYDSEAKAWVTETVSEERTAKAPFAIAAGTRLLSVARHQSFSADTIAQVFQVVLNQGEIARTSPSTDWGVEPVLDEADFEQWLADTSLLEQVSFSVKLPNPDAAESFDQIAQHLQNMDAELTHTLRPRNRERGLSKDFQDDPISLGLLEMALRSFAVLRAKGRSVQNRVREYNQKERVRKGSVRLPEDERAAQRVLGTFTAQQDAPGTGDG